MSLLFLSRNTEEGLARAGGGGGPPQALAPHAVALMGTESSGMGAAAAVTYTASLMVPAGRYCNMIEAPWLVNGGHGASLRHHNDPADGDMGAGAPAMATAEFMVKWVNPKIDSALGKYHPRQISTK
eukprot:COSAG01_NODE_1017_length_12107_cov_114.566372_4_plen_127_part_00